MKIEELYVRIIIKVRFVIKIHEIGHFWPFFALFLRRERRVLWVPSVRDVL